MGSAGDPAGPIQPVIAVLGCGAMGSAMAARLAEHGATVLTSLEGRSEASRARARSTGMRDASRAAIAAADIILSIVPPAQAQAAADELLPQLAAAAQPALFVDCNPITPASKRLLGASIESAGAAFVDATIIGSPPSSGTPGPRLYACGAAAHRLAPLSARGIQVRLLDGSIGTAAALKLCYSGINKGLTGLVTAMLLAAKRSGLEGALLEEMAHSLPWLLTRARTSVPAAYPKAARWADEMAEIAEFVGNDASAAAIYQALALFYGDRAAMNEEGGELEMLAASLRTLDVQQD